MRRRTMRAAALLFAVLVVVTSFAPRPAAATELQQTYCGEDRDCLVVHVNAASSRTGFQAKRFVPGLDFRRNTLLRVLDLTDFPTPHDAVAAVELVSDDGQARWRRLVPGATLATQGVALGLRVELFSPRVWKSLPNKWADGNDDL